MVNHMSILFSEVFKIYRTTAKIRNLATLLDSLTQWGTCSSPQSGQRESNPWHTAYKAAALTDWAMSDQDAFYWHPLPYPHSGTDTEYRSLNLFLFVLQICGYLRFGTICDVKPVCTPYSNPQLVSRKPYITKPCTGIEPACPNWPRHKKKHHHISDSAFLYSFTLSVYQSSHYTSIVLEYLEHIVPVRF